MNDPFTIDQILGMADKDQQRAGHAEVASHLRIFYGALVAEGFKPAQAMILVGIFYTNALAQAR